MTPVFCVLLFILLWFDRWLGQIQVTIIDTPRGSKPSRKQIVTIKMETVKFYFFQTIIHITICTLNKFVWPLFKKTFFFSFQNVISNFKFVGDKYKPLFINVLMSSCQIRCHILSSQFPSNKVWGIHSSLLSKKLTQFPICWGC